MDKQPLISIIVPVYKAEKYINECINSILSQTLSDFELILVNDGSPDNSGPICDGFAAKDSRIKVIHKKNGGASTARKTGVDAAKGKYIGWVDADDYIAPDMYSVLYELIETHDADIVECQYLMLVGNAEIRSGKEEPLVSGNNDFMLKEFFTSRMKPSFSTKLYKSSLLKNVRFPDRQIHVDCYVNMLFALMPLKYVRISDAKYFYVMREQSNMTTYSTRQIREAVYLYDYTMNLASGNQYPDIAKRYLKRDAINRLVSRYYDIIVRSDLKDKKVYSYYIRKKLGYSLVRYLIMTRLPVSTRINYLLTLLNFK